ncbi:chromosome segregation protein SMC, partial [Candidatus Woesearchaeota archaeon]|nr:chromosome segregation protein SMC [Candidatus Woesearchaeota archaeon]
MTLINKLVMHGFKSFAKRTELVFGKDFNCILGPNGSGKSNVIDALCFVLGKSSTKEMRAEKSANLIYNGGKLKQPAKFAEVSIWFDNSKKEFPIDEQEVKLTRLVKQNGQGVYKINDEVRTRMQIRELLSLAKIDPDGYSIILQGDIVALVDMSSIERRQMIEEISGISVYEDKKQKAIHELEKVDGKLTEAGIILTERDTYLKELKKERDQAQKYQELDSKITVNRATVLYRQIKQKEAEKEELDERTAQHQKSLDELNKELAELHTEIKSRKEEIEKINREIETRGEKEQLVLHKEVEKLKVDLATCKNRAESCRDEIAKIKNRKDGLKENLAEVGNKIKVLQAEKKAFEQQISQKSREQKDIEASIVAFRQKNKLDDVGNIENEIDVCDRHSEDIAKELQDMRLKQQEDIREKDKLDFQVQAIDEKIEKVLSVEKENKEQINILKQKKAEFKKLTVELQQLLAESSNKAAELGDARRRLLEAHEHLSKLASRQAQIQEKLGANIALTRILEMKKTQKIKGIHGTVSELGEVSQKYSLALEVAAGNKIKSIVVENDKVAAECIQYLKKNQLGIATFLPLNKIRGRFDAQASDSLKGKPGVHGKAVDLITYSPQYSAVFAYVFENAIIVDDIETARRLGIGTAKMVTLDGDVVEMSGAMQGGFRQKREGLGFNEKEVSGQIEQYEKISAEMGSKIAKLEKEKIHEEERITRLRELKANLEGEIITMEKTLHLDAGDIDVNKKVKGELNSAIKKIEEQLEKITKTINEKNRLLADLKIKKQQLRDKIGELRNPTLLAELNAFEAKRTELRESLIKLNSEIKNIDTQITALLEPELENIKKILKGHDKEIEVFDAEVEQLKERVKLQESDLVEKEKKEKEFYAQFKDLFQKRTKFSDEVSKREQKTYKIADDARKVEHKINTIALEVAKIGAELGGLQLQFEQFKDVQVDSEKSDGVLQKEIAQFEKMVENLGAVNMKALEIYDTAEKEYHELLHKKDVLQKEKEAVLGLMKEIEDKKKVIFMKTFVALQGNFKRLFSSLSTKGEAELVLENPEDPFAEGMLIKVRITGDKFLDIRSLSGGEKTMTALAFIFAVQEYEP